MKPRLRANYIAFGLTLLHMVALNAAVHASGPLAIQGAKIITISGETIEAGTIIIREGKIEAVGKDIQIPGEAKVIDATGKVVMPGFIDAHSSAAMSQANERTEVVPFLSVVDSIDPVASYFEECRRNGITSAAVVPGNSTLIGGQAAILKTAGQYVNDMLLTREAGLKLSLRPTSGSRMSQMAKLRKELDKAKKAVEAKDKPAEQEKSQDENKVEGGDAAKPIAGGDATTPPAESADSAQAEAQQAEQGLQALMKAIKGQSPVYIYCENGMDVVAALSLVKDYQLKPIFVLGRDCHKAAKLLGERGETVILDPTLVFWETNPRTRQDTKYALPQVYREAGVPFVFQTDSTGSRSNIGSGYFWFQAATAVKYGMSEPEALHALTLAPAKLLGIDKLVGSIEVGKDADLVILTGEPLDMTTWVEHTIIDGEIVYDRAKDEKLSRLLSPQAE